MGEFLVRRYGLTSVAEEDRLDPANTSDELEKLEQAAHGERKAIDEEKRAGQSINNYRFMNALAHLLIAMGLGTVISLDTAVVIGDVPEKITRAAYCTGSGASLLPEAERSGAQIYITGDVQYHAALDARICVLDVGHHSLEEEMMRQAAQMLAGRLTGADFSFITSVPPMRRVVLS